MPHGAGMPGVNIGNVMCSSGDGYSGVIRTFRLGGKRTDMALRQRIRLIVFLRRLNWRMSERGCRAGALWAKKRIRRDTVRHVDSASFLRLYELHAVSSAILCIFCGNATDKTRRFCTFS